MYYQRRKTSTQNVKPQKKLNLNPLEKQWVGQDEKEVKFKNSNFSANNLVYDLSLMWQREQKEPHGLENVQKPKVFHWKTYALKAKT